MDRLTPYLNNTHIYISGVLLTHAHFDHIYGLNEIIALFPTTKVYTNEFGKRMLLNEKMNLSKYHDSPFIFKYEEKIINVDNEEEINIGDDLTARAYFTLGHNPSCITWVIGDAVFTGDAYIPGVKTVTNLPGSNKLLAHQSELLIIKISQGRRVFPGHRI